MPKQLASLQSETLNGSRITPEHREQVAEIMTSPGQVRRSVRFRNARLFSRWYTDLQRGKHLVVVSEPDATMRHWIITAHLSGKLVEGEVEWKRS